MREERPARQDRVCQPRRPLALVAFAITCAVVLSCTGDTLYDPTSPPAGTGPTVTIVTPTSGSQVLRGQRVPVRVEANDADGVSSLVVQISGPASQTIDFGFVPVRSSVQVDTAFTVPGNASGSFEISAVAVDAGGNQGNESAVTVTVSDQDRLAPSVRVRVEALPRMERTDEIRVTVWAVDNAGGSGVVRTGVTALVASPVRADTVVLTDSETFSPRSDTVTTVFAFPLSFVDESDLPDNLVIEVFGLAYDAEDNCGAAVLDQFTTGVACQATTVAGTQATLALAPASPVEVVAVMGRTSLLPGGGIGADIVVDTLRSRAYVSNLSRNLVHTLDAASGDWPAETLVGSEPWGLAINPEGDSLVVANSGGTTISHVSLAGTPREDLGRRLVTHNTPLFEISRQKDAQDFEELEGVFIDFSDRPQFIAEDAEGRLLYSTRPTETAGEGTVRVVTQEPGWPSAEAKILLLPEDIEPDSSVVAIAHVDSVTLVDVIGSDDLIEIFDHPPGFPDVLVRSGLQTLDAAVTAMANNPDSDILWGRGTWQREDLSFQDTTFVTTSGDREWVAFGANVGPITLWDASAERIHSRLLVADLANNASERVTGLDMNEDGSLGAANGSFGSYYWDTSLRLLGSVGSPLTEGGGGAGLALHPYHPSLNGVVPSSASTVSFVGEGGHTVRILDTVHFFERGVLHIRDVVVGPLRAGPPLPSDNGGLGANCDGSDCVVVKLYGLTDAGGVVVIDVRRRDFGDLQ